MHHSSFEQVSSSPDQPLVSPLNTHLPMPTYLLQKMARVTVFFGCASENVLRSITAKAAHTTYKFEIPFSNNLIMAVNWAATYTVYYDYFVRCTQSFHDMPKTSKVCFLHYVARTRGLSTFNAAQNTLNSIYGLYVRVATIKYPAHTFRITKRLPWWYSLVGSEPSTKVLRSTPY